MKGIARSSAGSAADTGDRPGWIGKTMANDPQKTGLIVGIPRLAEYLNVARPTVYRYLGLGMPGNKINDTWHFHIDNIEGWFRAKTFAVRKDLLDEIKTGAQESD